MLTPALLIASLVASTPAAPVADLTLGYSRSQTGHYSLSERGADAPFKLAELPRLRLDAGLIPDVAELPWSPLDQGGGVSSDTRPVLALVLGLVLGFGIGHLVAQDKNGFILFLVVDVAIIAVSSVLTVAIGHGIFWGLGSLGLLVSHIIQGLDAYGQAGGPRIVEFTRRRAVELASVAGSTRDTPLVTTRVLGFSF